MHDVLIRGGTIHDGAGGEARTGDVAVKDGMIVAAGGRIAEPARQVIDADGAIVTPAWVDIHTHYDGQVTWDPLLTPSIWHGVTTVVMGNCGVGFAPAAPDRHDWLIGLMEGVEGIPGASLREAIQWDWQSVGEYLDALDGQLGINAGFMIGHSAIRRVAMGPECVQREASPDELTAMPVTELAMSRPSRSRSWVNRTACSSGVRAGTVESRQ